MLVQQFQGVNRIPNTAQTSSPFALPQFSSPQQSQVSATSTTTTPSQGQGNGSRVSPPPSSSPMPSPAVAPSPSMAAAQPPVTSTPGKFPNHNPPSLPRPAPPSNSFTSQMNAINNALKSVRTAYVITYIILYFNGSLGIYYATVSRWLTVHVTDMSYILCGMKPL